jgi:type II secretory pathway pseudopilin PulG
MMKPARAFSLVEVVVALGVFVTGVVGAIVLLAATTHSAGNALAVQGAVRVGESAAVWARQLTWEEAVAQLTEPIPGYATRTGEISPWDDVTVEGANYEFTLSRNETLSPEANDATAGFLAMRLQVTWPVWQTATERAPAESRETLTFNVAVRR